jgi:hypothetical protein
VFRLFIDGNLEGTNTVANIAVVDTPLNIGLREGQPGDTAGNIDEVRISNVARYTVNFTPQTSPHVNDADTLLLLHMDGTDGSTTFVDDDSMARPVTVTALEQAQVDTSQSKFGGASLLLDGTGDGLHIIDKSLHLKHTDTSTIEMWFYQTDNVGFRTLYSSNWYNSPNAYFLLAVNNGNVIAQLSSDGSNSVNIGGSAVSLNAWNHVALTSDGSGTYEVFVNGQFDNSASGVTILSGTLNFPTVGIAYNLDGDAFEGSIDEVRVSNNVRYTSNFTPDTQAFSNDADTLLLLHMEGTDGSTTFVDDNSVPPKEFSADLTVTTSNSTTATRIRSFDASFTSAFSPTVTVNATRNGEVLLIVTATMVPDVSVIRDSSATLLNIANLNAQAAKIVDANLTANIVSTLVAASSRIRSVDAAFASSATLDMAATRTRGFNASLAVSSVLSATSNVITDTTATLNSNATVTAQAGRIRSGVAQFNSVFTLAARADADEIIVSLVVTSSLTATPAATYGITAYLTANTNLTATVGRLTQASANLEVTATVAASLGQIVVLRVVYTIPSESRTHTIHNESRTHTIIGA